MNMNDRVNAMRAVVRSYYDGNRDMLAALTTTAEALFGECYLTHYDFISAAVRLNRDVTTEQIMEALRSVKEEAHETV